MQKYLLLLWALIFGSHYLCAQKTEYFTGGEKYKNVWIDFYNGDHEPELDDPLIAAGKQMTKAICEAIMHKDLKYRRYAIGAIGFIGDKKAIPTLEIIFRDTTEIDYFRGDALQAIYCIDEKLGMVYAGKLQSTNKYLRMIATAIMNKKEWLCEPSEE
ncbi:MAG: HEAT repeat domain-containing protein [Bacteroidota bacterium]